MNWSPFPFFRLAIFFITGILIFENFLPSSHFVFYSIGITGGLWAFSEFLIKDVQSKKLFTGLNMLLFVLSLGMLVILLKSVKQSKANLVSETSTSIYHGWVKEKLKFNPKPKFVIQANVNREEPDHFAEIIITFAETDSLAYSYDVGDEIIFKTKLKSIRDQKNPDAFNYAKFLKYKGIILNGFVKQNQHQMLSKQNIGIFRKLALQASIYSEDVIDKNIKNEGVAGIAKALLTGNKTNLDHNIYKAYADTGAIHVLSVSGLHVAIFISLFVFLFEKIKSKALVYTLIKVGSLLLIVWFYVILTGMSPSVLRAGVMVSMYLIGKNLFKGVNSFNIISLAALSMLIYDPYFLFQASFQFSFISLLSILYFQPKISKWVYFENKIWRFIWDLIVVSLAAQILMFPFTVYNFHQFPLTFALSGIVAVPIVTIIIYLGTLMIVVDPITHLVSKIIGQFIEKIIELLNVVIMWMSKIPFTIIDQIWINSVNLCLLLFSIVCLIHWYEMKKKASFYLSLVSITVVFFIISLEKVNASTQEGFTIYHTYNNDIIDIFQGTKVFRFVNDESQIPNLDMISKNHNIKCRVKNIIPTRSKIHVTSDKSLLIVSEKEDLSRLNPSAHYDFVYICINLPPEKIISNINAGLYILSPTLKPWLSKKWLLLHQNSGINVHQIKNDGPIVYRI